ncbi:MAG: hypothetical protein ACRD2B_11990 [Terriglobia bacterium]
MALVLLFPLTVLAAGGITGSVSNGTTHRPAANLPVKLLMPASRKVEQVAVTRTDASGRFSFTNPEIKPKTFFLLQVSHGGVDYHAPVNLRASATAQVNLKVYDSITEAPPLRITSARFLVRGRGDKVRVEELFALRNNTNPPVTYVNPKGTFFFNLAQGVSPPSVAVAGEMNLPLPQEARPGKIAGEYLIQYPLKPGLTVVMVAYAADYSSHGFELADSVPYPIDQIEIDVVPASLVVKSPLFKSAGTDSDTGGEKLLAQNLKPGTVIQASFEGPLLAAPQSENNQNQPVKELANPMTRLGLPLLGCFLLVLLWAMGVRVSKEWSRKGGILPGSPAQKELEGKLENLLDSVANLDELFTAGKMPEKRYWRERLELKARLVVLLKKSPPSLLEAYAARHNPR